MGSPMVSLRVLYTVNMSPQYILARAPEKIPFISADTTSPLDSSVRYGRAPLKACAAAICCSSPELRPDATKDFSVYILDPLEDLLSKNRHGQSGGVAVGMGLLSAILSPYTPDTTTVAGTVIGCGEGEEALEIIVSLRHVAPQIMHVVDPRRYNVPEPSAEKSTSKSPENNQSLLTSRPLPLRSLDERLFACYSRPAQNVRSKEPRKPNPSHSTRAHQLPTPYIGPPKRKYTREQESGNYSTDDGMSGEGSGTELSEPRTSLESEKADGKPPAIMATRMQTGTDAQGLVPPFASDPGAANEALPEAAVMLAALSSISSKGDNTSSSQSNVQPSPELISFLRSYLAYLETQKRSDRTPDVASSSNESTTVPSGPSVREAPSSDTTEKKSASEASANKENQKLTPEEPSKNPKQKNSSQVLPLGSGRFNARQPDSRPLNRAVSESATGTLQSRKRKLSNAEPTEQNSEVRRSSSAFNFRKPDDDLSGVRQNRGWGGLRVRSDGTLWGEQPPRVSSGTSKSNQQPLFFRSSGQAPPVPVPAQKRPFVIPEWAKGVPPPAPPPKTENDDADKDQRCGRARSKSKNSNRLGGKRALKRIASTVQEAEVSKTSTKSGQDSQTEPSSNPNSQSSATVSPKRPPIFAFSSPVGQSKMAALFQAFRTSPCRPPSSRKLTPSRPRDPFSTLPSSANRSSLFTPSPSKGDKTVSGRKSRGNYSKEDPPSPTPKGIRTLTPKDLIDMREEEEPNLPSSLPIASSDSLLDDGDPFQLPSVSSDSSVVDFNKVHDWSSLDLPPSSPPPPSSPSITPMGGSDLPCSDLSSCDISETESPSFTSDLTFSDYPSPAPYDGRTIDSQAPGGTFNAETPDYGQEEIMGGPFMTDSSFAFALDGTEGHAALEAFGALQNGLGQEDFREGFALLNSMLDQNPMNFNQSGTSQTGDTEIQNWLTDDPNSTPAFDFDSFFNTDADANTSEAQDDDDTAVTAATQWQDLLGGCVV